MKQKRTIIAIIMIFVLFTGILSSCAKDGQTKSNDSGTSKSVASVVADPLKTMRDSVLKDVAFAQRTPAKDKYDFGGKKVILASPWIHDLFLEPGTTEAGDKWLARVSEVEKALNVKIETVSVEYGYFCDKIFTAAQAGTKFADIIELDSRWLSILVYPGYIKPLNQLKTGVDIKNEKWHPTQLAASKLAKNIYGVKSDPVELQNVIFWNKTLFAEQNLPNLYDFFTNKTWTWDKMKEIAAKATKIGADGTVEQWGIGGAETERSLILSNNGTIMTEDNEGKLRFSMNNPNTIAGLEFLQDLLYKSKVMEPVNVTADWRYQFEQFTNRIYAMVAAPFYTADIYYQFMEDDFGLVPFPMGPQAKDFIVPSELNRNWALINNNPDEDMSSVVMDALFAPYAEDDKDSWKARYTNVLRDDESMKVVEYLLSDSRYKLDLTGYFTKVGTSSDIIGWYKNPNNNIYYSVYTNQKTPAAAISEKEDQAKTLINDYYANLNVKK